MKERTSHHIKMQPKLGLLTIIFLCLSTSVKSVPEFCLQCDSANDDEKNCGYYSLSESETGTSCSLPNACFTNIYEEIEEESDYPGWYTKRGCLDTTISCTDDNCITCEENNCNNAVFPSNRKTCLKCTDSECSNPISEYCNIYLLNNQDCVTLFDEEGKILLKNCYSDIPASTRQLCDESDYIDCKKCNGNDCNTALTRDGIKCHQCSGIDCLVIENVANLVDCHSSCYIGINPSDGTPVRGCASNFENTHLCSTDEFSSVSCFVCDDDFCNVITYPQSARLQCVTCGAESCDPDEESMELCPAYGDMEKCTTVYDPDVDQVIARGCLSTLTTQQKEMCDQNSPNCQKCAYNFCNKDDSKLKINFCVGCNSEDDSNCAKENLMTKDKRCLTDQCFSRLIERDDKHFGQLMERGCMADLLQSTECLEPDCVGCTGKNCNNKLFPENRITCKSCKLNECDNKIENKICSQYIEDEACFTFFGEEKEVVYKDCYADSPATTREVCDDPSNIACSKCKGNLCNNEMQRRGTMCFKCEGLECMTPTFPDIVECLSDCYVGLNMDGETRRGCANEISNSTHCGSSDETCLTCSDDHCNGIVFPTNNRLLCIKCLGDDCTQGNTLNEYCEKVHPDERCVTVFDSGNAVIERGCSSTVQNSAICSSESNSFCLKCNFSSCNIATSTSETFFCVSCSSEQDHNCVTSPNTTEIVACSTNSCYSRLLENDGTGQQIERGCGEKVTLCTTDNCQACSGERCNSENFPSNRHSCYSCFGDQCALGHLHEKLCSTYNDQNKECVTLYGADDIVVIYRDCYVDSVLGTRNICDDESDLTCSKCTGKNCNNDFERRGTKCMKCEGIDCFNVGIADTIHCPEGGCYVGLNLVGETKRDCQSAVSTSLPCVRNDTLSGDCLICEGDFCNSIIFPLKNRLICKECLGETCEEKTMEEKYCEKIAADETCVSLFDDSDYILERGCSSTVQKSKDCAASNSNCIKCSFDGCNIQSSKNELHHCVSCDSRLDPSCVSNSSQPNTKTCTSNTCYSKLLPSESVWLHIEKGCVADLQDQNSCTGSNCSACEGDRCNNIVYPSDRISCHSCRNEGCASTAVSSVTCELYNRQQQACVTLFNNENEAFYRGCYSDAASGTQEVCADSSQLLCTKCLTRDCNQDTARRGKKCYKCQGAECFKPNHPADVVDCLSNCYMGINEVGQNVRGCSSSFTNTSACGANDDGKNLCNICSDDYCNGVQFPIENRLQCLVCNDESCESNDDNLDYCQYFGDKERCVAVFSQDNKIIERGCSSSLQNQNYCSQNYASCVQCGSNGCNTIASLNSIMCSTCSSSSDINCVTNPTQVPSKYCEKGCFTRLLDDATLERGCIDDLDALFECVPDNKCNYCVDIDKCNVENYPSDRRSCRTCNSSTSCNESMPRLCANYKQLDKCVTIFSGYSVTIQGCLADQSTTNQLLCSTSSSTTNTTSPLCSSCSESNDCNIDTVRKDENCISCSSALEINCAQRPSILHSERCSISSEGQCFTRILNGASVRGCIGLLSTTELDQCRSSAYSQCDITFGQGSNNQIIPTNRLKCFQCDSRSDPLCTQKQENSTSALPCRRFIQPENCLKLTRNDGSVFRGCVHDLDTSVCDEGSCQKCEMIEDGCNFNHASTTMNLSRFCLMLSTIVFFVSLF